MNCLNCHKKMEKQREEVSNNLKKGKEYREYKRTVYWCKKDDVWVSVEIPNVRSRAGRETNPT